MMDEFEVTLKARELIKKVNTTQLVAPIEEYAKSVGAKIKYQDDLEDGQSGYSFQHGEKLFIVINKNENPERQRFTACHEIAHIYLGLPSEHEGLSWWSQSKRPQNEKLCDLFAAALLLPTHLLKPLADKSEIGLATIDELAESFEASVTSTGSQYATVLGTPCAFVLSENGKVRNTSRSTALREARAWIPPGSPVPTGSITQRLRDGVRIDEAEEVDAELWFENWTRGGVLLEEARYLSKWDQTLTLLWFEEGEVPEASRERARPTEDDDEPLLRELTGDLPWPGRSKRKK